MKIVFISANQTVSPYPVFPMGAATVCATLKKAGHDVLFLDCLADGRSTTPLLDRLRAHTPELICLSLRNIDNTSSAHEERYLDSVAAMVAEFRAAFKAPILAGGAGFSLMPEEILAYLCADYGIAGEGEHLVLEFIRRLEQGDLPPSLILRQDPFLPENEMGSADYTLSCLDYYVQHGGGMVGVQTKRGCLHQCAYCSYPILEGSRVRAHDPRAVVRNIERLVYEKAMSYLYFVDAVFNDDQGNYVRVIDEMLARSIRVPWVAFFKPTPIPEETLEKMKATGWVAAEIGADGATDETIQGMGKPFRWKQVAAFHEVLRKCDVAAAYYFIFGGPEETRDTVQRGVDNVLSLSGSVRFIYSGIRILPKTGIEELALRQGMITPRQSLLNPVYFFSPETERPWLEQTLQEKLAADPLCIYPPENFSGRIAELHAKGFCGPLWEMLLGRRPPRRVSAHGK